MTLKILISFVSPNTYDEVNLGLNLEDQIIEYRTVQKTKYCATKHKNDVIVGELQIRNRTMNDQQRKIVRNMKIP